MDKNSSPVEPHILTLQELYDAASKMLRIKKMRKDTPIMITTADRSIGGRAFVYVAWMGEGFDWESDQIRIATDEKILKYKNGRDVTKVRSFANMNGLGRKLLSGNARRATIRLKKKIVSADTADRKSM